MDGERIMQAIRERSKRVLAEVAAEAAQDMREYIGTSYPPASQPGEPPHVRSGRLQGSIISGVEDFVDDEPRAFVQVAGVPYWRHLEYGTEKMEARPFIAPMRAKWAPIFRRRIMDALHYG